MIDYFTALSNPDIVFLRYALAAGLLSSVAFGIIGSYVVARRISYLAGAIAHSVLAGIGISLFIKVRWNAHWCDPLYGAIAAALASAIIIGLVSLYARQREDTAIGAIWSIGMATGLLFLAKTPGYVDPMSYLFGNILLIARNDIWLILGLDILIVSLGTIFYNQLLAICFDEEFARLRGIRVELLYFLLLALTALTVVLLIHVVGIVLVIALLTLPAAVASQFSRKLWQMMLLSIVFCAGFTLLGLGYSYSLDLPSGPSIIVFASIVYMAVLLIRRMIRS
ncbi:metal ABC transporter permease [bacterium]|nr:metal ABC transporter permease [candidate division CSSED10-310 bacterium]